MQFPFRITAVLLSLLFVFSVVEVHAANTNDYPLLYPNANFAAVRLAEFPQNMCGQIGVDILLPEYNGLQSYNPCHNSSDPYYGSCIMSKDGPISYYKVMGFQGFPYGIFIDNRNKNYCTGQSWCSTTKKFFIHNWAKRIGSVALEMYPFTSCDGSGVYDPFTSTYGGARVYVSQWPVAANGGIYSPEIANFALPTLGTAARLNGFITEGGATVPQGEVTISAFQNGSAYASTQYSVQGFSSIPNNTDGYYNTGPLYPGSYKLYVSPKYKQQVSMHRTLLTDGIRLDFNLDKGHLGCYGSLPCLAAFATLSLKTVSGVHYVSAVGGQTEYVSANKTTMDNETKFGLVDLGNSQVALITSGGYYLQALHGGNNVILATAQHIGSWETFTYVDLGNDKFALRTATGHYVRAVNGGGNILDAKGGAIQSWETFTRVNHPTMDFDIVY